MDKMSQPLYKSYEINFPLVAQSDYEIYLENLLKEYDKKNADKKILVVVDDLDRLSADKIVEALDALKLFMEYERFIFIVPFDDDDERDRLDLLVSRETLVALITDAPPPDRIVLLRRPGVDHPCIFMTAKRTFHLSPHFCASFQRQTSLCQASRRHKLAIEKSALVVVWVFYLVKRC